MKNEESISNDWLSSLTVIGRILIAVPTGASLVADLYLVLSGGGGFTLSSSEMFIYGIIMLCGLTTLVYVAIKRFQQGLKGKEN